MSQQALVCNPGIAIRLHTPNLHQHISKYGENPGDSCIGNLPFVPSQISRWHLEPQHPLRIRVANENTKISRLMRQMFDCCFHYSTTYHAAAWYSVPAVSPLQIISILSPATADDPSIYERFYPKTPISSCFQGYRESLISKKNCPVSRIRISMCRSPS